MCDRPTKYVDHNREEICLTLKSGSENILKSNGLNSISKDALRDEDCSWLINYTIQ